MTERAFINGLAVTILLDGRVKIEGQAPMSAVDAIAWLGAHPPPQPRPPHVYPPAANPIDDQPEAAR